MCAFSWTGGVSPPHVPPVLFTSVSPALLSASCPASHSALSSESLLLDADGPIASGETVFVEGSVPVFGSAVDTGALLSAGVEPPSSEHTPAPSLPLAPPLSLGSSGSHTC